MVVQNLSTFESVLVKEHGLLLLLAETRPNRATYPLVTYDESPVSHPSSQLNTPQGQKTLLVGQTENMTGACETHGYYPSAWADVA